jgi:hypothetical protein
MPSQCEPPPIKWCKICWQQLTLADGSSTVFSWWAMGCSVSKDKPHSMATDLEVYLHGALQEVRSDIG